MLFGQALDKVFENKRFYNYIGKNPEDIHRFWEAVKSAPKGRSRR